MLVARKDPPHIRKGVLHSPRAKTTIIMGAIIQKKNSTSTTQSTKTRLIRQETFSKMLNGEVGTTWEVKRVQVDEKARRKTTKNGEGEPRIANSKGKEISKNKIGRGRSRTDRLMKILSSKRIMREITNKMNTIGDITSSIKNHNSDKVIGLIKAIIISRISKNTLRSHQSRLRNTRSMSLQRTPCTTIKIENLTQRILITDLHSQGHQD